MVTGRLINGLVVLGGILAFAGANAFAGETWNRAGAQAAALASPPSSEDVIQYVRDRFEIPETVKLTVEPLRRSSFPSLYESALTTDNGKEKRTNNMFISEDGRCFVLGNVFALAGASTADILRSVREVAKLPPTTEVTVGPLTKSVFPGFLKAALTAIDGGKTETGEVFVTRDYRIGMLGIVLPFRRDFVERLINTRNQPSVGTINAPVTIVEYADLECPSCALFHKYLDAEFLPKYGRKVRIIFKEFPLPMHTWSTTAAIANECGYLLNPSTFFNYRKLIFASQNTITATNVREQMLSLGAEVGLDRRRLATCLDTKASWSRVLAGKEEALNLGVNKTPSTFVNGRIVIGAPSPATFEKVVDEALAIVAR